MKRVLVAEPDQVWFRSVVEAYEGLCTWHAGASDVFELDPAPGREGELDGLLADLASEGSITLL